MAEKLAISFKGAEKCGLKAKRLGTLIRKEQRMCLTFKAYLALLIFQYFNFFLWYLHWPHDETPPFPSSQLAYNAYSSLRISVDELTGIR